jgi:hypothetical protein
MTDVRGVVRTIRPTTVGGRPLCTALAIALIGLGGVGCTHSSPTNAGSPASPTLPSPTTAYLRHEAELNAYQVACEAAADQAKQDPVRVDGDPYTTTTVMFSAHHPNTALCSYARRDVPVHRSICVDAHPDQAAASCLAIPSKYLRPADPRLAADSNVRCVV